LWGRLFRGALWVRPIGNRLGPGLPRYAAALLEPLQFSGTSTRLLTSLTDTEWTKVLSFCDRAQLTLTFGHFATPFLPDWVSARIAGNLTNTAERHRQWETAAIEIANCFETRGIDFALLKGPAHSPDFTPDPLLRAHGDIDLWCLPEGASHAWEALREMGYELLVESKGRHLPPLARPTAWKWRGDYFATDLPLPVDLHYSLWDRDMERIDGPPEREFWQRRRAIHVQNRQLRVLGLPDTLAFAALHSLMHMLHGDLRLQRAWEIAYFLNTRASDDAFWADWQNIHPANLRRLELTVFALAATWFQCKLAPLLVEEMETLPQDVRLWLESRAWSPVESLFTPNKEELWLHMALLIRPRDKASVFLRRMFPVNSVPSRDRQGGGAVAARTAHHVRTLIPTIARGAKWWWTRQGFDRNFLIFLFSSGLFDLGEFIFLLLYNLYLLDLGFNEKLLGRIVSAMTAGSFLGILPATALVRRWGLRPALVVAAAGASASSALRAVASDPSSLLLFAFLNGLFLSVWAVCFPPSVAASTTERNRTRAFSLVTSLGIGIGIGAGVLGGRLPAILAQIGARAGPLEAKRAALLLASAVVFLAIFPALRLRLPESRPAPSEKKLYPRGRFIAGFLFAIFVWSFATGAFNPFFNVYLAQRLRFSVERIGTIFSFSQLAQVLAILSAPFLLRKIPGLKGIASAQLATALMLVLLSSITTPGPAAVAYIAYMAFQYMTEPCLFSLLMDRVAPAERGGASALNFLATSFAGTLAAMAAGAAIPRFGYSFVLAGAAILAFVAAALMFATGALYSANPSPRPQSLAKTMPLESGSQAGV
jgi:predicted MFS family arabinose efflux permease